MILKVAYSIISILILGYVFLFYKHINTIKELESETLKNLMLTESLKKQNEVINKMQLNIKKYNDNKEIKTETIIKKYNDVLKNNNVKNQNQINNINNCNYQDYKRLLKQEQDLKALLKARYN